MAEIGCQIDDVRCQMEEAKWRDRAMSGPSWPSAQVVAGFLKLSDILRVVFGRSLATAKDLRGISEGSPKDYAYFLVASGRLKTAPSWEKIYIWTAVRALSSHIIHLFRLPPSRARRSFRWSTRT